MNLWAIELPAWAVMWLLAGVLFFSGKAATLAGLWRREPRLGPALGYTFGWVGMNPAEWLGARPVDRGRWREGIIPLGHTLVGAALLWGGARWLTPPWLAGWCGMVGLILMWHFGLFSLLAVFWQRRGRAVRPIMHNPAAAVTVAEFWGRRWNRAFRDLAHPFIFRPMQRRWGAAAGLWAGFLVSGLAHELVISVPARGGYGGPTGYFLFQALALTVEKRFRLRSRWFTLAATALPAGLLFPPPFVERVMIPFFQYIGALP